MNLFDKLPKFGIAHKRKETEYFFTLDIASRFVTAAVWGIEQSKLQIINKATVRYDGQDHLAESGNLALDTALADFNYEPTKLLFGVPHSWLQDDELKEDYVSLLKTLVKELEVTPLAYVSTAYSICHYYQKIHGVPLTGIMVEVDDPLSVTIVKAGKIVSYKSIDRTDNLPEDISKILGGVSDIEVLPSKILLFGDSLSAEELNKYKDEVSGYNWMTNLPFLHLPKAEVMEKGIGLKAVCLAGASEIEPNINFRNVNLPDVDTLSRPAKAQTSLGDDTKKELPKHHTREEVGFMEGDIEDVSFEETKLHNQHQPGRRNNALVPGFELPEQAKSSLSPVKHLFNKLSNLIKLPGYKTKHTESSGPKFLGTKFLVGIIILLVGLVSSYVYFPKAKVTVYIDPKVLENSAEVVADPNIKEIDEAGKKIPGKLVEIDVSGSEKMPATGKKQIGDPAKGKVLIYNKTYTAKILAAKTVLVGPGGINYILDNSVNIASKSAVAEGELYGKAAVSVTANQIGPEGNLSAGKELTVKGEASNSISAKVDQDITGGTSKEVTVVTADDTKKLLAIVSSSLKKKAKEEIQGSLTEDMKILEEGLQESVAKSSYSKNIGDQAQEFSLNLSAHYKGIAYGENDLRTMVAKLVKTNIPDGYILNLQDTETQADVVRLDAEPKGAVIKLVFAAKFKAKLMPLLDVEKIKKEIVGKTPAQVAEIVRRNETVIGSEIKTSYLLPAFLQRMPLLPQNISIAVTPK